MIRIPVDPAALIAAIDEISPKWRSKAETRTKKFRELGKYDEKSAIWSEIKPVFRRLQHQKCAFCERLLAGEPHGAVEHDLEHYRPKGAAKPWSHPDIPAAWHGPGRQGGYYWLAYDPANYATACKVCNSSLKADHFPIEGPEGAVDQTPAELASERPLLPYPLGTIDQDPAEILTFTALVAVPVHADPDRREHRRGAVAVAFFALNAREELLRDRAVVICRIFEAFERIHSPRRPEDPAWGAEDLALLTADAAP